MVGRSKDWFLVLLFGVFAVLALPGRAEAQTTTSCSIAMSTTVPVIRENDTSNRAGSSTDASVKLTITRADCLDQKLKYKFAMTVTGYNQAWDFEAWAGRSSSDCSGEYTALSSLKTCWKLGNLSVSNGVATAEFTPAALLGIDADPVQTPSAKKILTSCDDLTNTDRGRQTFTVHFLLAYSSAVQCKQTQAMYYSLTGPDAPAITAVNAADSALQVSWSSIAATLTTDVTYEFYCARNESSGVGCSSSQLEAFGAKPYGSSTTSAGGAGGTAGTAGASSAAGTTYGSGAGGSQSSAGDSGLASAGDSSLASAGDSGLASPGAGGEVAVASAGGASSSSTDTSNTGGSAGASSTATSTGKLSDLYCGAVRGKINTSGYTDATLSNKYSYAITVGVRDTYGNLGTLAPYQCQHPEPIDTFFESYSNAGGKAGGGFCNLDVRPRHGAMPAAFGAIGLLAWLRRRRQLPRRRGTSDASPL